MSDAKAIRKHTAQHDLFNRVHSIAADEAFVKRVSQDWYAGRFEVVPNQRCGTWYCDPSSSSKAYAYFKSTDGHTNNWNFNLRRSNLPFAKHAESKGGLILVDSTRRGKRMPDALSKTVPIWCTVINLALQLRRSRSSAGSSSSAEWDTSLYLPPNIVSPSERSQIEALLPQWAETLEASTLPLPDLVKPLRPFFIHPSTSQPPHIPDDPSLTPIMCVSSSRWVGAGDDEIPRATKIGWSTVGFEYVAGAGDDDELWARGLTPALYHSHRKELLTASRESLPDLVDELVTSSGEMLSMADLSISGATAGPDTTLNGYLIGIPSTTASLAVNLGPSVATQPTWSRATEETTAFHFVEVDKPAKDSPWIVPFAGGFLVAVPNPKSDGWAYSKLLRQLIQQIQQIQVRGGSVVLQPARQVDYDTIVLSPARTSENDSISLSTVSTPLSASEMVDARKALIPVIVTLLCSIPDLDPENLEFEGVDKGVIASQLHRLVALWPDGNPPRAALKRMNEVLMSSE